MQNAHGRLATDFGSFDPWKPTLFAKCSAAHRLLNQCPRRDYGQNAISWDLSVKFSLRFLCHHRYLVPVYIKKPETCNNCKSLALVWGIFFVSLFLISKLMLVSAETLREQWADRLVFMDTLDSIPDKRTNGYLNELVDLLFFRKLNRISNN